MDVESITRPHDFQDDIDAIGRNTQIPALLESVLLATGMGFAAVARVTESRWITCRALDNISFGLGPGDELEVETTLCHVVRLSGDEIVIDDAATDPVYAAHPTPARYGFRSFISVPIRRADGSLFGTLCALDPAPRRLSDLRVLSMFRLFAKLIGESLESDEKLRLSENAVDHERHLADAQERFIAILAHDLRNPISVLTSGFRVMERSGLNSETGQIVTLMKGSVARMATLIEDLLEHARSRLGDGIVIQPKPNDRLHGLMGQIVAELNAVSCDKQVVAEVDLPPVIRCDSARIAQLLSNLLGNAVTHGSPGAPITLRAKMRGSTLTISVANSGPPIPAGQIPMLFQPFKQGAGAGGQRGLGLGLYIAS
ncbi:MAG: GAF domain-containing sensor histidine kinase, partial [Paracoccaceae bacterium]